MIRPRVEMKVTCFDGHDEIMVDAVTTVNGKTWVIKATKKYGHEEWKSFDVASKQLGALLDPDSELFFTIRERVNHEYERIISSWENPYRNPVQVRSVTGTDSNPFDLPTRAFLSSLLSDLEAFKLARVPDIVNAETPKARLMAVLGAEAVEDVIRMIRENYQSCIDEPAILDAAIATRVLQEGRGKTEL
ncbi:hypothetical protein HMPREF2978_04610 [Corynebacterium sp. HMSC074C01]|uniref:hypothetical protein n=1 Tax=Corynebacterium sp. HMSC074C01 TaxID=1739482 RepID=UPI0008A4F707|nr:hypothetical protein [Corynebacterium sp. HMSC074C01]OFP66466.1 hypothetical protein HMPREF2978_04610 [Corynebacterium sp. HMSC074C01]